MIARLKHRISSINSMNYRNKSNDALKLHKKLNFLIQTVQLSRIEQHIVFINTENISAKRLIEYRNTVNSRYNECGGRSKSNKFGRIRYNQNYRGSDRGSDRGNGRGDRWGEYYILLGNLIQIQVYFQHLLKISSNATCLFRRHSLLSIKVIFRSYLKNRISEIVNSLER